MNQQLAVEQAALRAELENLSRRLDTHYRSEIDRLAQRLEANEARLARLSGGGDSGNGFVDSGCRRSSFGGAPPIGARAPRHGPGLAPAAASESAARRSFGSDGGFGGAGGAPPVYGAPPPPPERGMGMSRGGYPAQSPISPNAQRFKAGGRSLRKSEDDLAMVKGVIQNAVKSAPKVDAWEEPSENKIAASAIDRFEVQFKNAIERNRDFARMKEYPVQGLQALFQKLDRNHSGKCDVSEWQALSKVLEFQSDPKLMEALFKRYDLDRSGYLTLEEFGRALFKLDGDTEFKAKGALARMREVLSLRAGGYESLRAMARQFGIIDRDNSGHLSKEEFNIALDILFTAYNVKFSMAEKNSLFSMFDFDKSGALKYDEFVRGVRGDMNDFRAGFVKQAFQLLDTDRDGVVSTREISELYDVSNNPAVRSGKVQPGQAIQQFMENWDGNRDGTITLEEFMEHYQWVSSSIDNDDYFELMMRNAWHMTGGEGWAANTANLRLLVIHNNGSEEVVTLDQDTRLPHDPEKRYMEVIRRLQRQGVRDIKKVEFCE